MEGRTVPRPWVAAAMVEAFAPGVDDKVLEVGTGCGCVTALLARLAGRVHSVESVEQLAPYDPILVNLPGSRVPDALKMQLKVGGRLVMPLGRPAGGQDGAPGAAGQP